MKWNVEDETKLIGLVKMFGKNWKMIGDVLGRSPTAVSKKYHKIDIEAEEQMAAVVHENLEMFDDVYSALGVGADRTSYQEFLVTPRIAETLLEKNNDNRPVNLRRYRSYANDMKNGAWKPTLQPLMIGKDGYLIDGQHRLRAVVSSGVPTSFLICYDPRIEKPRGAPIDVGSPRSASFTMNENRGLVTVAREVAIKGLGKLYLSRSEHKALSVHLSPHYEDLVEGIRGQRRIISSASFRAAIVCQMVKSEQSSEYIKRQYLALMNLDVESFSPVIMSLFKQIYSTAISGSGRTTEMFVRTYFAFDPSRESSKILRIKDSSVGLMRSQIRTAMDGWERRIRIDGMV